MTWGRQTQGGIELQENMSMTVTVHLVVILDYTTIMLEERIWQR